MAPANKASEAVICDVKAPAFDPETVVRCLAERGFCILRNLFDQDDLTEVAGRTQEQLRRPAVAGTLGYSKVDFAKKLLNPFEIGGAIVPMMLNEVVIGIVERYMDSECVLAETALKFDAGVNYEYFPIHSDFSVGWKKRKDQHTSLSEDAIKDPVGVGAAIYLHDTHDGAFTYCDGTHKLLSPHGQRLADYPDDMKDLILSKRVRCDGKRGDMVLFDDRGFHGPDQPSTSDRLVILLDYFRVRTFGHVQVTPQQVWTSDLGGLSERQLRVLGAGADFMVPPIEYTRTRFRRSKMYGIVCSLIDKAYLFSHLKNKAKRVIGRA